MIHLTLLLLAFLVTGLQAHAEKTRNPSDLSEAELKAIAERELGAVPAGGSIAPFSFPESGMVSTAEILKEENPEPLAASEFETGLQPYRPSGNGRLSPSETYSYDALSSKPMVLLGGRHWFWNPLRSSMPWRAGLGIAGGFASHNLRIVTNRGAAFDEVRLNSFMAVVGPEAEIFVDKRLRWALGARFQAGKTFAVQATPVSSLDRSQDANIWEAAAHLRYQPTKSVFARLAFARRGILGGTKDLGTQENNYAAFIGFGM